MPRPRRTIILADDSDDIRKLVRMLLEMKFYHVIEANDGRQVLKLVSQIRPDLILMDLHMPVMDGLEATRLLRQDPQTRDIPVVGFSANCKVDWEEKGRAAGCNACLEKPINITLLEEVISRFFTDS